VRRKSDQLDLLTLGTKNHSSDPRFLSDFKYPNNWRLTIRNASRSDSGVYLCQISTHPPKVLEVQVTVEGCGKATTHLISVFSFHFFLLLFYSDCRMILIDCSEGVI
jgi:hypothetical protein